jgi:hypothetical protein
MGLPQPSVPTPHSKPCSAQVFGTHPLLLLADALLAAPPVPVEPAAPLPPEPTEPVAPELATEVPVWSTTWPQAAAITITNAQARMRRTRGRYDVSSPDGSDPRDRAAIRRIARSRREPPVSARLDPARAMLAWQA